MTNNEKYDNELQLLEDNFNWLLTNQGLSESAESHYRAYINHCKETAGVDLTEEGWNLIFNRRGGSSAIRGTNSEMLFETLCYLVGLKIEERVSDKKRQVYGEDFVVQARKVSVKTRKHLPGVRSKSEGNHTYSIQGDTNVYLYRDDFKPAVWRVDVLALVDPDTRTVTTLEYKALARVYCNVDSRGFCQPIFSGDKIMLSFAEHEHRGNVVHTRNLAVDLKEHQEVKAHNETVHT